MNQIRPTRPIPVDGGSCRAGCIPGSEAVDAREGPSGGLTERRPAPPRKPGCDFPSKASAQPRPRRDHARFWADNRIIGRVCRSFWRVHSISFVEPLLRGASAGREKMTQKSWWGFIPHPSTLCLLFLKKDCSRPSCLILRSAGPRRGAGARVGRGEGGKN